uniref:Uncharacterized protein n=1 Tax=Takifugu rubripes TaxID=31033 RepID=A0A674NLF7_TAKRU
MIWDLTTLFFVSSERRGVSVRDSGCRRPLGPRPGAAGLDCVLQLDPKTLTEQWRRQTLSLGQVKLAISLKYRPHQVGPPTLTSQQQPVFGVPIAAVARQEGGLVPHVVRCCVEEVERRGMDERLPGRLLTEICLNCSSESRRNRTATRCL